MPRLGGMLRGVLVLRIVAAADVPAGEAETQIDPGVAHFDALFAGIGRARLNRLERVHVGTLLFTKQPGEHGRRLVSNRAKRKSGKPPRPKRDRLLFAQDRLSYTENSRGITDMPRMGRVFIPHYPHHIVQPFKINLSPFVIRTCGPEVLTRTLCTALPIAGIPGGPRCSSLGIMRRIPGFSDGGLHA